jgi:hypothetical protein
MVGWQPLRRNASVTGLHQVRCCRWRQRGFFASWVRRSSKKKAAFSAALSQPDYSGGKAEQIGGLGGNLSDIKHNAGRTHWFRGGRQKS